MCIFNKKLTIPALVYIIASIFYVVFIQHYTMTIAFPYTIINPVFKSLPDIIALIVSLIFLQGTVRFWMITACSACALGDIMLGISREGIMYKLALIFYLIGHIFFIICFIRYAKISVKKIISNVLIVIYVAGIGVIVVPSCPGIVDKISVILYIVIISAMALVASHINLKKSWLIFIGASLFVLTDSINAVNKFIFTEEPAAQSSITENFQKKSAGVQIKISVVNPLPQEKTFTTIAIPLLSVIVLIYYTALFLIVFGFTYILNQENRGLKITEC